MTAGSGQRSQATAATVNTVNGRKIGLSLIAMPIRQAIANSSNQQVRLNGVSTTGGQLTSLNAGQSLLNTSVTASISSVTLGLNTAGLATPGSFTGAAVSSGNSLSASAIGNQSSLVRSGR